MDYIRTFQYVRAYICWQTGFPISPRSWEFRIANNSMTCAIKLQTHLLAFHCGFVPTVHTPTSKNPERRERVSCAGARTKEYVHTGKCEAKWKPRKRNHMVVRTRHCAACGAGKRKEHCTTIMGMRDTRAWVFMRVRGRRWPQTSLFPVMAWGLRGAWRRRTCGPQHVKR